MMREKEELEMTPWQHDSPRRFIHILNKKEIEKQSVSVEKVQHNISRNVLNEENKSTTIIMEKPPFKIK